MNTEMLVELTTCLVASVNTHTHVTDMHARTHRHTGVCCEAASSDHGSMLVTTHRGCEQEKSLKQ